MLENRNYIQVHANIRSAQKNLQSFDDYMGNLRTQFTVIGLTETWHTGDNVGLYAIDGYNAEYNNRITRSGGGVALHVKDCVEYITRPDLNHMSENLEYIFVEINKDCIESNTTMY